MHIAFRHFSLMTVSLLLASCSGEGTSTTPLEGVYRPNTISTPSTQITPNPIPHPRATSTKDIRVQSDYRVESLGKGSNITATVDVGTTPKSLYVLLSNYSQIYTSAPEISHKIQRKLSLSEPLEKKISDTNDVPSVSIKRAMHAPASIQEFNKNTHRLLKNTKPIRDEKSAKIALLPQKKDAVSDSKIFYLDEDTKNTTRATAKKIVSNIITEFGDKTLNIWVSDDSFGLNCRKSRCVTQEMVDALAETFLQEGGKNDIYDWVTNIYGEEWNQEATKKYGNLLGASNEITILLTDIDDDNKANGGVIGYFYAKDNYEKASMSGSNERIMFYIDAVMFANVLSTEDTWDINNRWPQEIVSTLAHEFVHMIEFYQKTILLEESGSETWLSEMLAETTEEMVATKLKIPGPRGVAHTDGSAGDINNKQGRYGLFNQKNTLSLTTWERKLADYSKVNAFGAYLTRNYGGAKLLHDMMHNTYTDEQAVVAAVNQSELVSGKSFDDLQKEWGIAVMLSDHDTLSQDTPTYNTGDFTPSTYNEVRYQMGSINFFNYTTQPTIHTRVGNVPPRANYYYKVGDNLTGKVQINITVDSSTEATLIVK